MVKKAISLQQMKLLWGNSHKKCAMCKKDLIQKTEEGKNYPIGEMAHIEGENKGSPRYNHDMTDSDRANYENLILLCPTCHTTIDNDPEEYTVEKLKQIKKEHEEWAEQTLNRHMPDITFAELQEILEYLVRTALPTTEGSITVVPPKQKINRNNLSSRVEHLITNGMLQVRQVKGYLNEYPDLQFAERLKAGFVHRYQKSRKKGLKGDALFYDLLDFAASNSPDFNMRSAGLSVLTYFFELCDVFEK